MPAESPLIQSSGHHAGRLAWRLTLAAGMALFVAVALAVIGLGYRASRRLASVQAELRAIRQRGEPIEPQDLAKLCPPSAADQKRLADWLRLCELAEPTVKFTEDAKPLPLIGELAVPDNALSQPGSEVLREQARTYLSKHSAALALAHELARDDGPVPFQQKYEDGFNAKLPWIQSLRALSRVLALELRLRAAESDIQGGCDSWATMFALSEALGSTSCGVSNSVVQSMRFGMVLKAMEQAEFLINQGILSDAQLRAMHDRLAASRPEREVRQVLLGERVMGFVGFQHPEQIFDHAPSGISPDANIAARSEDCLLYLTTMRELIRVCELPFPQGRERATAILVDAMRKTKPAGEEDGSRFAGTNSMLPGAVALGFEHAAEPIAMRELLLLAIHCRRFAHRHGRLPENLTALIPEFCPELPTDPYSGKTLLYKPAGAGILIYSVGKNGTDDSGKIDRWSGDFGVEVTAVEQPE